MSAIANIVGHTPVWVFPLIVAVLWLGSINLRERNVSVRSLFILPVVMLVMSIGNSIGTSAGPWTALVDWLCSAAIGAVIGWYLTQTPRAIKLNPRQIVLPGSAIPLIVCIALIVWRYAFGYLYGRYPELRADRNYALVLIAGGALLGGVMLGRYGRLGLWYWHATASRESSRSPNASR
jgi:preprotein translocase subunit Sec61beta